MQVSLPALKAFESAARLGSFKAAAAELSISPTAVSHHITRLEQRLNVILFERTVRKVVLTELGKELAAATNQGFQTIEVALENIVAKDKQINVATTSSFAALVLIPMLQEFAHRYPDISVNIISGENIEANKFHLPVRLGRFGNQSHEDVISHEHFNLFRASQTGANLNDMDSITIYSTEWKNPTLPKLPLQAWLEHNGLQDKAVELRYFDQELFGIQQALVENAYVFCSKTLARGYVKAGMLKELDTQAIKSDLCYYIPNKETRLSRQNYIFVRWLEEVVKAPQ